MACALTLTSNTPAGLAFETVFLKHIEASQDDLELMIPSPKYWHLVYLGGTRTKPRVLE